MSSLRRIAQTNNAATSNNSPRNSGNRMSLAGGSPASPLASGSNNSNSLPTTPRTRIVYPISPTNSPSLSASKPFDWNAARQMKPPPYGSPLQSARVKALRKAEGGGNGSPKRIVRKKSFHERIAAIPSNIMFEISLFPNNVPLPEPKTSARLLGGTMHLIHFCVRVCQLRVIPDDEISWEDLYNESRGSSWFDWTTPVTVLLIATSLLNAMYLFTRIKLYNLHHRRDPVSSPNAAFTSTELDFSPLEPPPLTSRFTSWLGHQFSASWRFLFNFKPPAPRVFGGGRIERVQQLSMWAPGELENNFFAIYSPVHALLWIVTTGSNWIMMFCIMGTVGIQLHLLVQQYEGLIKDKAIIAAEVMHEYDETFVNPRINPIRKDASVMTHQSEVVNVWEH